MGRRFSSFVLKTLGWTAEGSVAEEDNCVILAAPHTSIWDFAIGYFYYRSIGGRLTVMIKKEAFFFPVKYLLRAMGGFPMDRSHPQATIMNLVEKMKGDGVCHLVICPEGTRKPVHKWKTGYHTIARAASVPVYISYFDYKTKHVGLGPKVELTDDARADTDRIQQMYEDMHLTGLHPEGYVTK